eukprot:881167-Pleurochrysis_carterae.AAC.1
MGNSECGPKGAARCDGFEYSSRDNGKKVNDRIRVQNGRMIGLDGNQRALRHHAARAPLQQAPWALRPRKARARAARVDRCARLPTAYVEEE